MNTKKTIQVRSFSEELHDRVLVEMAKRKMTLAELLEAAVREYLRKGRK